MDEKIRHAVRADSSTGIRLLMNRYFFTGKILFLGLVVAQLISTVQVYLSDTRLFHSLENIKNAGYLTVPNQKVADSLLDFAPAFYGGLFFTLSVGALLSLLGLISALMWNRLFKRNKFYLIPFLILWAGLTAEVNRKGLCPLITLYFLFIPPVTFAATLKCIPSEQQTKTGFSGKIARIIPVLILASLWLLQINSGFFENVRDHLLFSNGIGKKVNDFYYRYTLYPAEVIKSLDQKIIRTYRLDKISNNSIANHIRKRLINYDFLEIKGGAAVDLSIAEQDGSLLFMHKNRIILTTSISDFIARPGNIIKKFSMLLDRQEFFRQFILFSLLTGFPAAMIIFFYSILTLILCIFFDYRRSSMVSLFLCLAVAFFLSLFFYHNSGKKIAEENISGALRSGNWHDEVMALKKIEDNKMDITRFGNYREILSSPHIPVRYWLAKVLGTGHDSDSYKVLMKLMDDPSPNVVCMAFYSLGQRGEKGTVSKILKRIQISDNWYEQWYAYKALKALGWKQKRSK